VHRRIGKGEILRAEQQETRMFLHNQKMIYTVRIDEPNPEFAKMLLEQFGGPNGELAAAMRYFTQGWAGADVKRRDMLLDIATEELSHLEMVGQLLVQLLRNSPGAEIDEVEGGYLGDLLDGRHEKFIEASLHSGQILTAGPGTKLVDSMVIHGRRATSIPSANPPPTCARTLPPKRAPHWCTSG
jgi:Mn-containing catalase